MTSTPRLRGRPERVFVSVDESTGKSTVSFMPADVGAPVQHEDDAKGVAAMTAARSIAAAHPGCTVHGPHFHTTPPPGRKMRRRPPPRPGSNAGPGRPADAVAAESEADRDTDE